MVGAAALFDRTGRRQRRAAQMVAVQMIEGTVARDRDAQAAEGLWGGEIQLFKNEADLCTISSGSS